MASEQIKIVMLGDSGVGKTSLFSSLYKDTFIEGAEPTVGASFNQIIESDIKLQFWDTAGQERFLSLSAFYYRDCDIPIIVYDINDWNTTKRIEYYLKNLNFTKKMKMIIVGNKSDLAKTDVYDEIGAVENIVRDIVKKYDEKVDCEVVYIVTSAKTKQNIDKLGVTIREFAKKIVTMRDNNQKQYAKLANTVDIVPTSKCSPCGVQ